VNKQMIAMIAVGVVAAVAAVLFLLPSETVTVVDPGTKGVATVAPDGHEFKVAQTEPSGEESPSRGTSLVAYDVQKPTTPPIPITRQLGMVPAPGVPLDQHGRIDSALWMGTYRMLLKEGQTDLAQRVHEMGTTVSGVTSANELSAYTPLFDEERKLSGEVRGATTNTEIIANCDRIEGDIAAVESGHLHPVDKRFETAATP
jgi:hypothetical protein